MPSTSEAKSPSTAELSSSESKEQQMPSGAAPLNEAEKQYRKENFGDEYHLLRDHGLTIWKEDDRHDGRAVLRTYMANGYRYEDPRGE
ncbi:hypothetical protein G7Z17_g7709 [Cylindrodendrum hubeiense]|uniref:Uncharacterized protein n=1 Tax=Cylindrodendrum hubeiense TaxID=595255 RepID=A0A9P5H3A9_9HYPO|nr:hypothetical protein G7Z17_g7709 [Cylindrodendrum hubeiense]